MKIFNSQIQNMITSIKVKYSVLELLVMDSAMYTRKLIEINEIEQNLWILTGKSFKELMMMEDMSCVQ